MARFTLEPLSTARIQELKVNSGATMRRTVILTFLGMFIISLRGSTSAGGAEKKQKEKEILPLLTLSGWNTKITKKMYCRVESEKAWNALYFEHQFGKRDPDDDMPWERSRMEVNFGKYMIFAIFPATKIDEFVLNYIT